MKKNLLLLKGYLVIMCLIFCPFFVYAGGNVNDNNIPKKINLQGRYTKSYGDPVTNTPITVKYQFLDNSGWGSLKEISTTTDSEGLYNLNLDVNLSSTTSAFRVGIDSAPQGDGYPLASSPYAFYASTAVYALSLDAVNGKPLENGNFDSSTTYNIKVATSTYAVKTSSINTNGTSGYVWGMINSNTQGWMTPDIKVSSAGYADKASTSTYAVKTSSINTNGNKGYVWGMTNTNTQGWMLKVSSAAYADNAGAASTASTSTYAVKTSSINTNGTSGYVWGMIDSNTQGWMTPDIKVTSASYADNAGAASTSTYAVKTSSINTNGTSGYVWGMIDSNTQGWTNNVSVSSSNYAASASTATYSNVGYATFTSGESISSGDVVVLNASGKVVKCNSDASSMVVGVAIEGVNNNRPVKVVYSGIVENVKCTGSISIGDLLVTSSSSGSAKTINGDSQNLGCCIGKALSSSSNNKVKVLVNLQ